MKAGVAVVNVHPKSWASRILGMERTSKEDIKLDRLWREVFKQPLPMLEAPDNAPAILE